MLHFFFSNQINKEYTKVVDPCTKNSQITSYFNGFLQVFHLHTMERAQQHVDIVETTSYKPQLVLVPICSLVNVFSVLQILLSLFRSSNWLLLLIECGNKSC
jgi:hypothetical protein